MVLVRSAQRTLAFRAEPTGSMAGIESLHVLIASWAREIAQPAASVLTPDVGGALWLRQLRIIDLAGLCDREIAKLLKHPHRLSELILDRKPTFVQFHANAAVISGLPDSPRFKREYLPIAEAPDSVASQIAGRPIVSGIYVHRDHAPAPEVLDRWRRASR